MKTQYDKIKPDTGSRLKKGDQAFNDGKWEDVEEMFWGDRVCVDGFRRPRVVKVKRKARKKKSDTEDRAHKRLASISASKFKEVRDKIAEQLKDEPPYTEPDLQAILNEIPALDVQVDTSRPLPTPGDEAKILATLPEGATITGDVLKDVFERYQEVGQRTLTAEEMKEILSKRPLPKEAMPGEIQEPGGGSRVVAIIALWGMFMLGLLCGYGAGRYANVPRTIVRTIDHYEPMANRLPSNPWGAQKIPLQPSQITIIRKP